MFLLCAVVVFMPFWVFFEDLGFLMFNCIAVI